MAKQDVHYAAYLAETLDALSHNGLLLVAANSSGRANVMTIGWGVIGWIWGKPIFTVLVRPSRYTYEFLEDLGEFTVNVPPRELAEAVAYCGSVSGRRHDKFTERGLTAMPGRRVRAPIVAECVIHYECRTVHKNDVLPEMLAPEIAQSAYCEGDYHRIYYGEILAAYADEDARERLAGPTAR